MKAKLWQDWVLLVCAAWLFASPFVLDFADLTRPAAWLHWVVALALFVSASEALVVPDALEEWVDSMAGLALLVGPWALGFSHEFPAAISAVATGVVVAVCAVSALVRDLRHHVTGHHWAIRG